MPTSGCRPNSGPRSAPSPPRSAHAFHRVRIDNYVGERLILHGWGGSFGTTLKPILFRRGAKHWRAQRVHPGLDWTRAREGERITGVGIRHEVDRDISDMLRRLDRYSSAKAGDLLAAGDIGSLPDNIRRCLSRILKCYVGRARLQGGRLGPADRALRRALPAAVPPQGPAGAGAAPVRTL